MSEDKTKRRDGSFIVRVSKAEKEVIDAKVHEAGYKSVSAYVRDYIAREKPQQKAEIKLDVIKTQRELMNLAAMLNADVRKEDMIRQMKVISRITMGE